MNNLSSEDLIERINQLLSSNLGDAGRLNHLLDSLRNNKSLTNSDSVYLDSKIKQLSTVPSAIPPKYDKLTAESIDILSNLIELEFGDSDRLRYILHTIKQGKTLFSIDNNYLTKTIDQYHVQQEEKKSGSQPSVKFFSTELQSKQSDLESLTKQQTESKQKSLQEKKSLEEKLFVQQTELERLTREKEFAEKKADFESKKIIDQVKLEEQIEQQQSDLQQQSRDYEFITRKAALEKAKLEEQINLQQVELKKLSQDQETSERQVALEQAKLEKTKLEEKISMQQTELERLSHDRKLLEQKNNTEQSSLEKIRLEEQIRAQEIELEQMTHDYDSSKQNAHSEKIALENQIKTLQLELRESSQDGTQFENTLSDEKAKLEKKINLQQIEFEKLRLEKSSDFVFSPEISKLESKLREKESDLSLLTSKFEASTETRAVEKAALEEQIRLQQASLDQLTEDPNSETIDTSQLKNEFQQAELREQIQSQHAKLKELSAENQDLLQQISEQRTSLESQLYSTQSELNNLTNLHDSPHDFTVEKAELEAKITSQQTKLDELLHERSSSPISTLEKAELETKLQSKQTELDELTKDYDTVKESISSDRIELEAKIKSQQDKLEQASIEREELEKKLLQRSIDMPHQTLNATKKKKSVFSKLFTKTDFESDRIIETSTLEEKIIAQQIKEHELQNTLSASLKTQQIKLVKLIGDREEAERKAKILSPALEHQISYLEKELEKFAQVSELAEKRALQTKANLESKIRESKEIESKSNLTMDLLAKQRDELEKTRLEREAKLTAVGDEELKLIAQIKHEKQQIRKLLETQAQLKSHMTKNPEEVKQELKEAEEQIYYLIKRDAKKPLHSSIISALDELNNKLQQLLDDVKTNSAN